MGKPPSRDFFYTAAGMGGSLRPRANALRCRACRIPPPKFSTAWRLYAGRHASSNDRPLVATIFRWRLRQQRRVTGSSQQATQASGVVFGLKRFDDDLANTSAGPLFVRKTVSDGSGLEDRLELFDLLFYHPRSIILYFQTSEIVL